MPPVPARGKAPQAMLSPAVEQMNVVTGRLRMNEERYSELRKKLLLVEQNMLSNHKKAVADVKSLQSELNELRRTLLSVEDKIIMIIKELQLTPRKEEVGVLKRYLELWDPVKFVTEDQVEKIIDEKLGRKEYSDHRPRYDSPS